MSREWETTWVESIKKYVWNSQTIPSYQIYVPCFGVYVRFDMMNISDKKFPSHRMCSFSSCTFHDSTMYIDWDENPKNLYLNTQCCRMETRLMFKAIDTRPSYFLPPLIELFDILFTLIFQSFHSMRGLSAFYCLTTAKIICRSFFLFSRFFDQVSSGKSSSVSDQNDERGE